MSDENKYKIYRLITSTLVRVVKAKDLLIVFQVSAKSKELKTTIDLGLLQRDSILKNIASQYEQWSYLVC
jgi:hypothetical protein